ncbi:MAG: PEP-CTERM sorting domain-containing protein, partial [Rubrivivax sp.]
TWEGGDLFGARIVLSKLSITNEGFDFLKHSLGLLSTGVGNFFAVNAGRDRWGSTTLNLRFSVAAVPEPSAYALAGVGLLVVWGARRARRLASDGSRC